MLFEVKNSRKDLAQSRFFTDDYFDLTIWYDSEDEIIGFQLCYGKPSNEHALTWRSDEGFLHETVDDGESTALRNDSPILLPDGIFPYEMVKERFIEHSIEIDAKISAFVSSKIMEAGKLL